MARENKIAHDYFLDCCKKYGVEVVSDRRVRSHYVTICKVFEKEIKVDYLSIYGQGKEKFIGCSAFKGMMQGYYIDKKDLAKYDEWDAMPKDLLYEPKPKESDLKQVYKLLDKALTIANKSEDIPQELFEGISSVTGMSHRYLLNRGEL